jgi:hypothetical protein
MTADSVSTVGRPRVVRLALRARVLAAIRGGLSVLGGVAAVLVGARAEAALLGWAVGATLVSIILAGDRRGRLNMAPQPLPADAIPESWAEIARTDVFPSTVGVAVLVLVGLSFEAVLAGIMAGILGGMALMTIVTGVQVVVAERRFGGDLYVERATRLLYIRTSR